MKIIIIIHYLDIGHSMVDTKYTNYSLFTLYTYTYTKNGRSLKKMC